MRLTAPKSERLLLVSVSLIYLLLYGLRLDQPHGLAFDEEHQVLTAQQFTTLSGYHEWVHPPLGMTIMAGSIKLLGDTYFAWRLPSFLAGFCSLILLLSLVKLLKGTVTTQLCVAVLMLFDGLSFTMARIGMVNAMMVAFMLAALHASVRFWIAERGRRVSALVLTGLFLGLSLGTKWTAAPIVAVLGYVYWYGKRSRGVPAPSIRETVIFLVIFPLEIYFASYAIVPFLQGYSIRSVFPLQWKMLQFHLNLVCNHRYLSSWESWPFLIRPVWFYFKHDFATGLNQGVICLGNPLVFIPLFVGLGLSALRALRNPLAGIAYVGFFAHWLQWVPVARPSYFHYLYPAMPFAYLAIALLTGTLIARGGVGRIFAYAYLCAVVAMFAYWYPLYVGLPVTDSQWLARMWLRSWI